MKIRALIFTVVETILKVVMIGFLVYHIYGWALEAYNYGYALFLDAPKSDPPGVDITVSIPYGSSVRDMGKVLEERGVIKDANLFFLQERLSKYHGKLKDGTFTLNTSMTAENIMQVMSGIYEDEDGADSPATSNTEIKNTVDSSTDVNTESPADGTETTDTP